MTGLRAVRDDEVEVLLDFITAQQADPATGTCYLGTRRDELRLELEALGEAWPGSAVVAGDRHGRLLGAVVAETDTELGRSWLYGPWTLDWARWARPLLEAAIAGCPPAIVRHEISADVAHVAMARLAAELGWPASVPNHVFVADAASPAGWPADDPRVRPARAGDAAAVGPLHDAEFPDTYLSTAQMIAQGLAGERTTVVSESAGRVLGYASGTVQPDGSGYLDFIGVLPEARGTGVGRALLATVCRRIMTAAPKGDLNLTVQHHREAAVGLYRAMGFRLETTIVGYSSPRPAAGTPGS